MGYSVGSASFGIKAMIIAQLLQVLFPVTSAGDPGCNTKHKIDPGQVYEVYSSKYPNNYPAGKNCSWIVTAPEKYTIQVLCKIDMIQTEDEFLISITGDPNFVDADNYYQFNHINLATPSNKISIGLFTAPKTQGGGFFCTVLINPVKNKCNCGWKNTQRIAGGTETKIHEYPMMAGLVEIDKNEVFCGATIIGRRYALSAAHCFDNRNLYQMRLLVGAHNISSANNASKLMELNMIIKHPLYDRHGPKENDIAIAHTTEFIEYNIDVGPACLPFRNHTMSFAGETVDVLGWGLTKVSGSKSNVLLKTDVKVESPKKCSSEVGGTADQICTFKAGHDSCQYDSGGPLLWLDGTNHIQLVGVVSNDDGCASKKPSLNARVTSYLDWIQSESQDESYCVF